MKSLVLLICTLSLAGCADQKTSFAPVPYTNVGVEKVRDDAKSWVDNDPDTRYWEHIQPTGSMLPFISHKHIVLLVRYAGQAFPNGATVIFNRGDAPRVIHVAADQTGTHIYVSGFNNHESDGWFPKSSIEGLVVGQLSLP